MVTQQAHLKLGQKLGLIVGLVVLLAACDGSMPERVNALLPTQAAADATPEVPLYPIAITVHPGQAQVILTAQGSDLVAMLEQPGPTASFDLPAGDYSYEVRASSFETFLGSFSLPQNRHLEVWLNRR
jgi:hypothetical protein